MPMSSVNSLYIALWWSAVTLNRSRQRWFLWILFRLTLKNMWYEILPTFFIITAGLGLPGWGLYHIHNLTTGNHYKRSQNSRLDRINYQRDKRLTGNPYKINGLDTLPDE